MSFLQLPYRWVLRIESKIECQKKGRSFPREKERRIKKAKKKWRKGKRKVEGGATTTYESEEVRAKNLEGT